jgi:hypothetical protein
MRDRVPTKPNRYAVYDDNHNFVRYEYHERADEPTEPGTPLNKATLLTDATAALYGLGPGATVNDVLVRNALPAGSYAYVITLKLPDGSPVEGFTIGGVTSLSGGDVVTDANGMGVGMSASDIVTLTATSLYIDLENYSNVVTADPSGITYVSATFQAKSSQYATFATTTTFEFSSAVEEYDACVVGGGGGGGGGGYEDGDTIGAGGGGGGYVTNVFNLIPITNSSFTAIVGAGGAKGAYNNDGKAGGSSQLRYTLPGQSNTVVASALNGAGGKKMYYGGAGNGAGGNSNYPGVDGTVYEFDDNTRSLFGGGGGGAPQYAPSASTPRQLGGAPYGGRGSNYSNAAQSGKGPGGGGGGGTNGGADGYRGQVSIRWRYAS